MNVNFEKMNETDTKSLEDAIAFFKANKERIKKDLTEATEIMKEMQSWEIFR